MRSFLAGFVACIVLGIAGAVAYSYSGLHDIAAANPDNQAVDWLVHNTYQRSLARAASAITVPDKLDTPETVKMGAKLYGDECIYCHGAPGEDPTALAKGLNPPAPILLAARRQNPLNETFWVVKNGVKMTAMPAWGKSYDDQHIWAVAAFLSQKRGISADDYKALVGGD
jgi:mono/diheme cytochrome c family protein